MALLEARNLHKTFKRSRSKDVAHAVSGIDITVQPGERVALLGPNGAGKTTTLLMLLGVVTPDSGSISINGIDAIRHRREAAQYVGFTAGYLSSPARLRVWEYLKFFAALYGMQIDRAYAIEQLDRFGIAHLADAMSYQLSSGQKTLMSMVRSMLHKPKLLVLDEPTAYLDPDVSQRVREGLMSLNADEGSSFLITSHNMLEIERLAQRIVFIANGRVIANGTAEEITSKFGHDELEAMFVDLAQQHRQTSAKGVFSPEGV